MKTIYRIAWTELQTLFYSPIAWLIIVIFSFQSAMVFANTCSSLVSSTDAGYATLALTNRLFVNPMYGGLFPNILSHLYLYIPLLTMGLMSRELGSGSIKLLYSSPVTNIQIILGKFLSMMVLALVLVGVLLFFVLFAGFHIEHFDYPAAITGLLGIYLLICAYAAVGLFMSSLTSYQVVAALLTLITLTALNYIKNVGQEIEFVRDITYWLSISGRVGEFINGLICSEDLLYFIIVIVLFLTLAIIRLQANRQKTRWTVSFIRYMGVTILTCGIGYVSALPSMMTYYDATHTKSNTLTEHSQEIVSKMEGGLTITTYVNVLDERDLRAAIPKNIKRDHERFRQYTRFKPEIKMEYVYYYDTVVSESLDKRYPKLNTEQRAKKLMHSYKLDSAMFITPKEIRSQIDLWPEGNKFVRLLERDNGQKTFLRVFNDMSHWPSEREITAAFKRLVMELPKVGFVVGHGERSINRSADRDYYTFTQDKPFRYALLNQGFDVENVNLDKEVPAHIKILVLAEPRQELNEIHQANLAQYINRGGNLLIGCTSNSIEKMRPILEHFGVEQIPGTLVKVTENYAPDMITALPTQEGAEFNENFDYMKKRGYCIVSTRISGLKYDTDKGYKVTPLFETDSLVWNEVETTNFVDDTVILNPAKGEVQGRYVTALALERKIADKDQRIIILGDADYISNGELGRSRKGVKASNYSIIMGGFFWLSDEEVPIDINRPPYKDNRIELSVQAMSIWKVIMMWVIPIIVAITSIFIWLRRRGR